MEGVRISQVFEDQKNISSVLISGQMKTSNSGLFSHQLVMK